ncbi:MAG: hypothetical protein LCH53_13685 [Bacteroidetes bacterium]|nr:hypothetical protein [Bacteroidota bacterium]
MQVPDDDSTTNLSSDTGRLAQEKDAAYFVTDDESVSLRVDVLHCETRTEAWDEVARVLLDHYRLLTQDETQARQRLSSHAVEGGPAAQAVARLLAEDGS